MKKPYKLGTETPYGKIRAIHSSKGERSYFMVSDDGTVTLCPAEVLEKIMEKK